MGPALAPVSELLLTIVQQPAASHYRGCSSVSAARVAGKPVHSQTVVTQREGEAPEVCLEFGEPENGDELIVCRIGKADCFSEYTDPRSGERTVYHMEKADHCDLCKVDVSGKPVLYMSRRQGDSYYEDIEIVVCESCTSAAFWRLRVARRRLDRRSPGPP